jgi:hypothetical protein
LKTVRTANCFKLKRIANIDDFTIFVKCGAVQNHDRAGIEQLFFSMPPFLQGLKPGFIFSHLRHD